MKISRVLLLLSICLGMTTAANAEQLSGRLFSTPAERAQLDHLRQISKQPTPEQELEQEQTAEPGDWSLPVEPAMPVSVSVQGYVKRSDGKKGTVWVNEQPLQENSETGDLRVGKLPRSGNQVEIDLPANGKRLKLKAGQIYLPETDSVTEDKARVSERLADPVNAGLNVP